METDENITALNYSAHAIESMKETAKRLPRHFAQSIEAVQAVSDMLRKSVKFLLPNCAELLDPMHVSQAHIDLLKLPYPITAFEAPWQKVDAVEAGYLDHYKSTRRIALCWEPEATPPQLAHLNIVLERFPQSGVFVLPISWIDNVGFWNVGIGGAFIPYENTMAEIDKAKSARSAPKQWKRSTVLASSRRKPGNSRLNLSSFKWSISNPSQPAMAARQVSQTS